MKKILSVLLALTMLFACTFSAVAETAENVEEQKAEEMETVLEWLSSQIPEDEALEMLSWDKETILAKLEDYTEPLQYTTKEEIADVLEQSLGIFNMFAGLLGNSEIAGETEESEGNLDLGALLSGLLGGDEVDFTVSGDGEEAEGEFNLGSLLTGLLSAEGNGAGESEGSLDLSGLLGGLMGGEDAEIAVADGDDHVDLSGLFGALLSGATEGEGDESGMDLSALFGALLGGEGLEVTLSEEESDGSNWEESYEIYGVFDGTFWKSGDLTLESVFQDGYYKVAVTEGDTELSYLCELDELQEGDNYYLRLTGIGTGVEEFDAEQEDHGIATFLVNDEGNLVWQKADGTEVIFTEVVDPLATNEWYAEGKTLRFTWNGGTSYTITIDDGVEGNTWIYECELDEATDTLTGVGSKAQYGEEIYADANATFTFNQTRILLTWKDDKAEEAANGLPFEMVESAFTMGYWEAEGVEDYTCYFTNGKYILELTLNGTRYAYVCTYDRDSSTLNAVDPATLDPEEFAEPENFRSIGYFEMLEDDRMLWMDGSGATGADGLVLNRAV